MSGAGRGRQALAAAVAALKRQQLGEQPPAGHSRLSGLQRQVLALYREFLRAARAKSPEFEAAVRTEFRKQAQVIPQGDTNAIEWYVRRGRRQLATLRMSQVKTVSYYVK